MLAKDLILRGAVALTLCAGAATLYVHRDSIWSYGPDPKELIGRVGLSCNGFEDSDGVVCTKGEGSEKIEVKRGTETFELSTLPSGDTDGKIKLYKDSSRTYFGGLKFSIEAKDIPGTGTNKLEELETYEVTEEGGKYYLTRKTEAKDEIKARLGIDGSCTFPEDNSTPPTNSNSCELDGEKIKKIKFENGKDGGATMSSGNATLGITKLTTPNDTFPFGYSFTLSPSQPLTYSTQDNSTINANIDVEFKIKRNNGALTLERAWDLNSLAEKVGLENCNGNNECSIKNGGINVRQEEDGSIEEGKTKSSSASSNGKIKVHKDIAGHREGFKFVIEDGDISLNGGSGSITKLEEFETYEIEEENGKYFLSRKTKALRGIGKILGIPENCDELAKDTQSSSCTNLTKDTLKNIKFEGKSDGEITITGEGNSNIALKISRTSDSNFPLGYRFTLSSDKDISIPQTTPNSPLTVKKKTNTEFKIRKNNGDLTLEKAWSVTELAKKVGLENCTNGASKTCSFKANTPFNVLDGDNKWESVQISEANKTMTYGENAENHSQGFKFTAPQDIALSNGGGASGEKKIFGSANGSPTYEIIEKTEGNSSKWYLSKRGN